jgi:hypothetical protein
VPVIESSEEKTLLFMQESETERVWEFMVEKGKTEVDWFQQHPVEPTQA